MSQSQLFSAHRRKAIQNDNKCILLSYTWVEVVEPGGGVAGAQDIVHGVPQVHRQAEHVEQKEDDIEHS